MRKILNSICLSLGLVVSLCGGGSAQTVKTLIIPTSGTGSGGSCWIEGNTTQGWEPVKSGLNVLWNIGGGGPFIIAPYKINANGSLTLGSMGNSANAACGNKLGNYGCPFQWITLGSGAVALNATVNRPTSEPNLRVSMQSGKPPATKFEIITDADNGEYRVRCGVGPLDPSQAAQTPTTIPPTSTPMNTATSVPTARPTAPLPCLPGQNCSTPSACDLVGQLARQLNCF